MNGSDLALAIGPPTLALALKLWSIPSNRSFKKEAIELTVRYGLSDNAKADVENSLRGSTAVGNFVVTSISSICAIFALFYTEQIAIVYLYCLVVGGLFFEIFIWSLISGRSYRGIAEETLQSPLYRITGNRFSPWSTEDMISVAIYLMNGVLIILPCLFYFKLL